MKLPISEPWGKLSPDRSEWHPLEHHCVDVAVTTEALLRNTILGRRLARLAGLGELPEETIQRLCVFALWHDIGKVCEGFQNKGLPKPAFVDGHIRIVCETLADRNAPVFGQLLQALDIDALLAWGEGDAILEFLFATLSHHGLPKKRPILGNSKVHWSPGDGQAAFRWIADLTTEARRWFPAAWSASQRRLPSSAEFQHAFAGLLALADWVASDSGFFEFSRAMDDRLADARDSATKALRTLGLALPASQRPAGTDPYPRFLPSGFEPRPAQAAFRTLDVADQGSLAILEAETGSGKTEAALAHFLRLHGRGLVDGLYFALPTRTAATQIYERVCVAVRRAFPGPEAPPCVLAVPGYLRVDGFEGQRLAGFDVRWDDPEDQVGKRGWAAEHSTRYLAGAVVVGTVDQVLLSSLSVKHSHLRATALLRHLLVVDEVHASDAYMTRILREVLRFHCGAGGHALLMSATLGSTAWRSLVTAVSSPEAVTDETLQELRAAYPALTVTAAGFDSVHVIRLPSGGQDKLVQRSLVRWMSSPGDVAGEALSAADLGARVLVIRNTVRDCQATQEALERIAEQRGQAAHLFRCSGVPAPHHGRFAAVDRTALDGALEERLGRQATEPCVVVATQTVEQSLDLDADLLITDLCPMDVLLQRIGRLQRHARKRPPGFTMARVVVLVPEDRRTLEALAAQQRSNGPHGLGRVYENLSILEATWRALETNEELRLPLQNRVLVETTTRDDLLAAISATWRSEVQKNRVRGLQDERTAEASLVDRSARFGRFEFGDIRPPTRLGAADRIVKFAVPPMGPFGILVESIKVPWHLTRSDEDDEGSVCAEQWAGGFDFEFAGAELEYDRHGLRSQN